jgi:hypothetical protein
LEEVIFPSLFQLGRSYFWKSFLEELYNKLKYFFEIKFNSIGDLNSQSSVYLKLYCCYFFHFIHSAIGPTYLLSTFWHFYRSI